MIVVPTVTAPQTVSRLAKSARIGCLTILMEFFVTMARHRGVQVVGAVVRRTVSSFP